MRLGFNPHHTDSTFAWWFECFWFWWSCGNFLNSCPARLKPNEWDSYTTLPDFLLCDQETYLASKWGYRLRVDYFEFCTTISWSWCFSIGAMFNFPRSPKLSSQNLCWTLVALRLIWSGFSLSASQDCWCWSFTLIKFALTIICTCGVVQWRSQVLSIDTHTMPPGCLELNHCSHCSWRQRAVLVWRKELGSWPFANVFSGAHLQLWPYALPC